MLRGNCQRGFRVMRPLPQPPRAAESLAGLWANLPRAERGFKNIDYQQAVPPEETAFALWFDGAGAAILIRAEITATGSVRPGARNAQTDDIPNNDSLEVEIDTAHNHADYLWLHFDSSGVKAAARRNVLQFSLRCDRLQKDEPVADGRWSVLCEVTRDAWYSLVHVPFALLAMRSAGDLVAWGFNVVQRRWVGRILVESAWSPVPGESQSPWDFGEVLAPESPVELRGLDFGEVYHDWNALKLSLQNVAVRQVEAEVQLRAWFEGFESTPAQTVSLGAGQTRELELRFELDSCQWHRQDIELTVREGARLLYRALFSAGHNPVHGGACMILKHGVRWFDGPPPQDPSPADPDFARKKRRYILSRLPDFPEMGWWGGPRGDWILRDRRGSGIAFNLLSNRILEELGDMIAERFTTDDERVIAAALLAHRLVIYSYAGCRVQASLSPLASLRYGATICSGYTCVAAGILGGTPRADGKRGYRGYWTNAYNHTILTVELPKYRTLVDPTLGAFHYIRDNSRLATEEELFNDPTLSRRTLDGNDRDYGPEATHDICWYGAHPYPPPVVSRKQIPVSIPV